MIDLAVVVDALFVDDAIETIESEGIYDDARRIRERDGGHVELPVTAAPEAAVGDLVRQDDPDLRATGLDDYLRLRGFSEAEIDAAPGSWAVIGDVVLVRFDGCPRRGEVAEALLDLQGAETVLDRKGIGGEHRVPDVEVVAGSGDTETVHTEHGTRYALDLAEVMFSPGNKAERVRMGEVAGEGERVLDMFAGIGYFALPMARSGAEVTAIERNPVAFRYLTENAVLNGVEDRVAPIRGDCREVVEWADDGIDVAAERVVMGYYDAHEYLDAALAALDPGGTLHVHEAVPDADLPERPVGHVEAAAEAHGRPVESLDLRRVKTHSEGVYHVVVDARIG